MEVLKMKKVKMTPGEAIAITLGIWAVGFLILTLLYKIFVTVRSDIDGANDRSVANVRC
jgi:hypothetical protein